MAKIVPERGDEFLDDVGGMKLEGDVFHRAIPAGQTQLVAGQQALAVAQHILQQHDLLFNGDIVGLARGNVADEEQ
ncbi:MAG: hypothetical protein U5N27_21035 [Rhizobium sp.]|nr:hypothetical protein [Rhizobium sp.]